MMLAMPSAPALPFGLVDCAAQELGQRSGLPMNEYLMSAPPIVPWVCQPQYCGQKPDDAVTSADVRTKYTPFVSLGTAPAAMASDTTDWMLPSVSDVPYG